MHLSFATVAALLATGLTWCQMYPCMRVNAPREAKDAYERIIKETLAGNGTLTCWVGYEDPHTHYCDWNDLRTPARAHDAFLVVRVRHVNGWILDTVAIYWQAGEDQPLRIWDSIGDDPGRVADTVVCVDLCAYVALADQALYSYVCEETTRPQIPYPLPNGKRQVV